MKKTHRFFDSILIIAHNECRKVIELFIVCVTHYVCKCVHVCARGFALDRGCAFMALFN